MAGELSRLLVVIGARTEDFNRALRDMDRRIAEAERRFSGFVRIGNRLTGLGQTIAVGLTLPIVGLAAASVRMAADLESAFAGVRKTVDGTEQEFAALKQEFDDLSKRIPIAVTELYRIGEAAGQLGIRKENLIAFTETMAKLGVATNMSSDDAATALARLANITQMPQEQFDRLGASIVALGNSLATTESEITEMGLRLAGAGNQVGMTEAQILGFAGALSSVGIAAEMGGSAFSRVFLDMQNAVLSGNANLQLFAQVAGMTSQQFAQAYKDNAAGAVSTFVEGLGRLSKSGANVVPILESLGLSEIQVRDALLRAANAGDLFRNSINLASDAWEKNTALNKEANERFKTAASQWKLFKNNVTLLAGAFGGLLTPALLTFIKPLTSLIDYMAKMNDTTKKWVGIILLLVAVLGPLLIGIGVMMKLIPMLSLAVKGLGAALMWLNANPLGALITLIGAAIAIGILFYKNMDNIKYYGLQAWGALVTGIWSGVLSIIKAIKSIPGINKFSWINEKLNNAEGLANEIIDKEITAGSKRIADRSATEELKSVQGVTGGLSIPGLGVAITVPEIPSIPDVQLPGAASSYSTEKSVEAAEKVKTAWVGTSEALRNALDTMRTRHESAAMAAEMQGNKLASLRLTGQQLNEQMTRQKEIVAKVREEIEANTAAGILEGETSEDLAKRTDELNKKLAEEENALVDLEKQIYDTSQSIRDQAAQMRALANEVDKTTKKYNEDMAAALTEYQQKVSDTNAKLAEDEKRLTQEYQNQLDQRTKSLRDFVGLFDAVASKDVSGTQLLDNLKGQVKTFEDWSANIQALAARGVDQGLIAELKEMGPKAAPEIAALNTLTDDQLVEYVDLWRIKNEEARAEAISQLSQQKIEMEQKLIEIRAAAQVQLEQYRIDWQKKNAEVRKNFETEMTNIKNSFEDVVGKGAGWAQNLMEAFAKGITDNSDLVKSAIMNAAADWEEAMPAHSPAEKGPLANLETWGKNFVSTFANGIKLKLPSLAPVLADLANMVAAPVASGYSASAAAAGGGVNNIVININGVQNPDAIYRELERRLTRRGVRW